MIIILLVLLLSPALSQGYEHIWGTDFSNEEGFGYYGDELNLPTTEWTIDLRGASLNTGTYPDYFHVQSGVLKGRRFKCSLQLNTVDTGVLWKSRSIDLDQNKAYYANFHLETNDEWEPSSNLLYSDFVRIGYLDDSGHFFEIYQKSGITERNIFSATITNTSSCQLIVEVDCSSVNEIFKLRSVNLYYDTALGNSSDLVITKLCSPDDLNFHNRYIQITNISSHLIDLSNFSIEGLTQNTSTHSWELNGFILPRKSLIIGDTDATRFICDIGKFDWSLKNRFWSGLPNSNSGAQIVENNTRQITDRVVGVNFYHGYAERSSSSLLASNETDVDGWDYQAISSVEESEPGIFVFDETLPISLFNTNFSFNEEGCLLNWTTYGESNLLGYNLFYAEDAHLDYALKLNAQIIMAQNSVQYNHYSYSLSELVSSGYLWIQALSLDEPNSFSSPIFYNFLQEEEPEIIEVVTPFDISIYPNPTSSASYLKISNSDQELQEISIYNVKGQLVGKLKPQQLSQSYNIEDITNNLSSGIYFVSSKFASKKVVKKLVITK